MQLRKILVPTDFSENAAIAVAHACELARQFAAEVHIINVVDNIGTYALEMELAAVNYNYDVIAAEKRAVELLQKEPGDAGVGCRIIRAVEIGAPADGITRYASEHEIDLIVVSTHGRSGLSHLLLGSVAENVVRMAPCPVLTVRPESRQLTEEPQSRPTAVS